MTLAIITLFVFGIALLAMSVGVLFGREPLRGSCGGVMGRCAACSGTCEKKRANASSPERENP